MTFRKFIKTLVLEDYTEKEYEMYRAGLIAGIICACTLIVVGIGIVWLCWKLNCR